MTSEGPFQPKAFCGSKSWPQGCRHGSLPLTTGWAGKHQSLSPRHDTAPCNPSAGISPLLISHVP